MTRRALLGPGSREWRLPPPPTRDAILRGPSFMQGIRVTTQQYGTYNVFGPDLNNLLLPDDRRAFYAVNRSAGATVCQIGWAGETYAEPDFAYRVPGPDMKWVRNPEGFCDLIAELIIIGGFAGALVMLPGDGETGVTRDTYGRQWVMDHVKILTDAMHSYRLGDLTRYSIIVPGYDGVWYGWQSAEALLEYAHYVRELVGPTGYQALEFGAGICHLGNGKDDFTRPGGLSAFDLILQEFAYRPRDNTNQIWQPSARLLGPAYRRSPDQPADSDPGAPYAAGSGFDYLSEPTPRGPWYRWPWEVDTYGWVRERLTLADVQADQAYIHACGWPVIC